MRHPDSDGDIQSDAADILATTTTFGVLTPELRRRIARQSPVVREEAGVELFRQGDIGRYAFLVLEGTVSVEVETDMGRVSVARLGRGGLVGEIGAFALAPRTASVVTESRVALLRIEQETVTALIAESPGMAMAIVSELGHRLQKLNGSIAVLTQAARALAADEFRPEMLDRLRGEADRFSHFAEVFEDMAGEIRRKRMLALELTAAAEIQKASLPSRIDGGAHAGAFEISAMMTPAKHVGGDLYDYFMVAPDTLAVAVGDVSGKGVPAALFMSRCQTILRAVARRKLSPGDTLAEVNDLLCEGNGEAMFVTLAFAHLHLPSGRLTAASGGHGEVFVVDRWGGVEPLAPTGPALGLIPGAAYGTQDVRLTAGAMLLLASDGITEAFDPAERLYGTDQLVAVLAGSAGRSAGDVLRAVSASLGEHTRGHPQSDDITAVALRYLGTVG